MRGGVAGLVFVLALLLVPAASARPVPVDLVVRTGFEMDHATLLVGRLTMTPALLEDPGLVGAERLELGAGVLVACPLDRSSRGVLPSPESINGTCRGGVRHENPEVRFGSRTWIEITGNHTATRFPDATLSAFAPGTRGGLLWAAVASPDGLTLELEDGFLRFVPLLASSEVVVRSGRDVAQYNGTDYGFVFDGEGDAVLRGAGVFGFLSSGIDVAVEPADDALVPGVLSPRTLLDLQEAVLGPDRRDSMANATALLADHGRVPRLLRGALVGHLDGDVGEIDFAGGVALVRADRIDVLVQGTRMTGTADVAFALAGGRVAVGGDDLSRPPWILAALLWLAALAAVALRRASAPARGWERALRAGLLAGAFVVWDRAVAGVLGEGAPELLLVAWRAGGAAWGAALSLLAFEAVGLLLAWLLLVLPLRTLAARFLGASRAALAVRSAAPPVAYAAFALLAPGPLLALALAVARL